MAARTSDSTTSSGAKPAAIISKKKSKKCEQGKHLMERLVALLSSATSAAHSFLLQNDLHLLPSQTLALESLLSSLSSFSPPNQNPVFAPPPPSQCWFHRFLSADDDTSWSLCFRMSKPSFFLLLGLLSPSLPSSLPSIRPDFALAAGLYRLAHNASYKAVGLRFGLDTSDACRAFFTVCKLVNEKLWHLFDFHSNIERIVVGFGWMSLPNCCGVLGIGRFGIEGNLLGKNGSLLVQALVDAEGRFLDVSAGWPCTLKPESVLHRSQLFLGIEESRELNGPFYELGNGNAVPQYILGEGCFPLLAWLITPYMRNNDEGEYNSCEKEFNLAHNKAIGLVRTAFRRVRARWQLLAKTWKEECIQFLPFVIVTGCLLHNFLVKCNEPQPDEDSGSLEEEEFPFFVGESEERGRKVRDALAEHLHQTTFRK